MRTAGVARWYQRSTDAVDAWRAVDALPYFRSLLTFCIMKTTLVLPDPLMVALKRRAAERRTSLSALATELLQRGLDERPAPAEYVPNFPVFKTGPALVDLPDMRAVRDMLDEEKDRRLYPWLFEGRPDEPPTQR